MLKYAASRKSMHFDDVLQFAKLALAGIGELPPTLFVYSAENKVVVPLGELPDSTQKRILSLTSIGADFRRDKNIGKLSEVYLATVSSVGRIGQHQTFSLSNLPPVGEEAREVLAIISLDVKTGTQESRVYEVVREKGDLTLKEDVSFQKKSVHTPLLPAFAKGYISAAAS